MPKSTHRRPGGPRRPPGPPLGVRTGFLLSRVGREQSARFLEALAPLGLRPKQFALLNQVALAEGSSQRELGRRLRLDPSGLVGSIDELERRGLLERRAHPADRRRHALHLTADGRAALAAGRTAAQRTATELLGALDEDEIARLHDLLARIASGLGGDLGPAVDD